MTCYSWGWRLCQKGQKRTFQKDFCQLVWDMIKFHSSKLKGEKKYQQFFKCPLWTLQHNGLLLMWQSMNVYIAAILKLEMPGPWDLLWRSDRLSVGVTKSLQSATGNSWRWGIQVTSSLAQDAGLGATGFVVFLAGSWSCFWSHPCFAPLLEHSCYLWATVHWRIQCGSDCVGTHCYDIVLSSYIRHVIWSVKQGWKC